MTETDLVPNEPQPSLDPTVFLEGDITPAKLASFRTAAFKTVDSFQQLRDWLFDPRAQGTARGIAMWALGRHEDAAPLLAAASGNEVANLCLAESYAALGQIDNVKAKLPNRESDATQALTWLRALDTALSDDLIEQVSKLSHLLRPADQAYFRGRVLELQRDVDGSIAAFDEVLAHDENHRTALFRLALNVDLRGED